MRGAAVLCAAAALLVFACALAGRPPPIPVDPLPRAIRYAEDVEPILERRCVTCHSCYNAPCQLKLSSYEGVDRGGSRDAVYSSTRLVHQKPTRLFFDAHSSEGWRALGFHSVTRSEATGAANDSILLRFLDAKRVRPVPEGEFVADSEDLTCAADGDEATAFLEAHPDRGMPFGFPALEEAEYEMLGSWLAQGAPGPDPRRRRSEALPARETRPRSRRGRRS
jgi:hypothetical protein